MRVLVQCWQGGLDACTKTWTAHRLELRQTMRIPQPHRPLPFLSAPRTSLLPIDSTGSRLTTHCSPLLARANKTSTNEFGTALNVPLPPRRREICVQGDLHSAEKCGDNMPTRQYSGSAKELFQKEKGPTNRPSLKIPE